jgi:hypothetical protein
VTTVPRWVWVVGLVAAALAFDRYFGAVDGGPPLTVAAVLLAMALFLIPAWIGRSALGRTPDDERRRTRRRVARFLRIVGELAIAPALLWAAYDVVTRGSVEGSIPSWALLLLVVVGFPAMIIGTLADD